MSASRFGRVQKTAALVPLALLSAAWTAGLTAAPTTLANVSAAAGDDQGTLPDGSSVPSQAIEAPASVSATDDRVSGTVGGVDGDAEQIVATSSTNGIPSAALAAYQRAESVINAADRSCHLTWQLVAAIGRVESNHGRYGGSALDADGVATPPILGLPLDGTGNVSLIRDTDAGQYDGDLSFDRAVGPMQFIPSTWAVVGVDADNDGVRDPQDIDDAALATAVYLCSGDDDLATLTGQRDAVYRYNHSESYVDLVLSIMDAYLDGDYVATPDSTLDAGYLTPSSTYTPPVRGGNGGRGDGPAGQGGSQPTAEPAQPDPTQEPSQEPEPEPTQEPSQEPTRGPRPEPQLPLPSVSVPPLPETSIEPVDEVLTLAQAIVQCTLDGYVDNLLRKDDPFDQCVKDYTTKG